MQRRSLRQTGGYLALFAVWLQLALSFGHLHPEDVWGRLGRPMVAGQGVTQVTLDHRHEAPGSGDATVDPDGCAICAAAALFGSALLPDAVRLPAPVAVAVLRAPVRLGLLPSRAAFLLFQTRAPPEA